MHIDLRHTTDSIQFTHTKKHTLETTTTKKKKRQTKSGNKMVNRLILIWQNAFKWEITKTTERKKQSWILTIYAKQNTTRSFQSEIFTINANKSGPNGGVANNSTEKNDIQFKFNDFISRALPIFFLFAKDNREFATQ